MIMNAILMRYAILTKKKNKKNALNKIAYCKRTKALFRRQKLNIIGYLN